MSKTAAYPELKGRRAEILAESLLLRLKPEFLTAERQRDQGFDFLLGLKNARGGISAFAVEVKWSESSCPNRPALPRERYRQLADSNLPVLVLWIDVKHNTAHYTIVSRHISMDSAAASTACIRLDDPPTSAVSTLRDALLHSQVEPAA